MAQRAVVEEPVDLEPSYSAPYTSLRGQARSSLFHPDGYSLWKVLAELEPGAELTWSHDHGDEGIFVIAGELECEGKAVGTEGAVIVEAGAPTTVRALAPTSLVHFGPVEQEAPANGPYGAPAAERRVHVFDAADAAAIRTGFVTYYGDGSCPTCRMAMFTVDRRDNPDPALAGSHKHSEDEIIHVLDGEMHVGPAVIPAGRSVAVPGELRYGYKAPAGLRFINYRRDASTVVFNPGDEPRVESRKAMAARFEDGPSGA